MLRYPWKMEEREKEKIDERRRFLKELIADEK
jgi:hypothetical protein